MKSLLDNHQGLNLYERLLYKALKRHLSSVHNFNEHVKAGRVGKLTMLLTYRWIACANKLFEMLVSFTSKEKGGKK